MNTTWSDDASMDYHSTQYKNQKESTLKFSEFIGRYIVEGELIFDLGAGAGAATNYLSTIYQNSNFKGIDSDPALVDFALKNQESNTSRKNTSFEVGDFNSLGGFANYAPAGVVSLQTLSWLPEFKKPMEQVYEVLKPNWIALSSLFYEGSISAEILVTEHERNRSSYYNVISLKDFGNHAKSYGYEIESVEKFNLSFDIPKPENSDYMGTYTKIITDGPSHERIQISGPLIMSWYFVGLVRSDKNSN